MSVNEKMTAIADAIRGKTGGAAPLTLDEMATAISGIETGGGGSMESGEFTSTLSTLYGFTIPVSSKKTHILVYPKVFEDETHHTGRCSYMFTVDGWGQLVIRRGGSVYLKKAEDQNVTFGDTTIEFNNNVGAPWNLGECYWFAW